MSKPSEGMKKIAALNLKSMLAIFTCELDKVIRGGSDRDQPPQPVPPVQVNNSLDDFPVFVDPPMPLPIPPLVNKASSGFDMDCLDQ